MGGGSKPRGQGSSPRIAAVQALSAIRADGDTLTTALDRLADGAGPNGSLDSRDQSLARAIVRTAARRRGDIDWCLAELMARPLPKRADEAANILRVAAAQLLFMRQAEHAAVDIAVSQMKASAATGGYAKLANAVLRRMASERDALLERLPADANTPDWLYRRWAAAYGEATAAEIANAHRQEPPLDIAFDDPDAALPQGAVRLPTGGARLASTMVSEVEGYAQGRWWVQDVAAQLPVLLLGEVAGLSVLDMCAAPGGKTMQLASRGAKVTACEVDAARAERLAQNLARTGLSDRAEIVVADARKVGGTFDAVLLDAPCSATGTLRRQADVAWSKSPADIKALARVQRELIDAAVNRVREGGTLVYATCSLEREEGEAQLAYVRETHATLALEPPLPGSVPARFATPDGAMRTLPHMAIGDGLSGLDGFFAAKIP